MEVEKFDALVQQLNDHKAALLPKVEEYTLELARKEELMQKKENRIKELKHIIETQEFTQNDINQLEREKKKLQEEVNMSIQARMRHEEVTLKSAIDLEKRFSELREVVEEFNLKIESMDLEKAVQCKVLISIQKDMAKETDQRLLLGGVSLKSDVIPVLNSMIGELSEKASALRRTLIDLSTKKSILENCISELNEEVKVSGQVLTITPFKLFSISEILLQSCRAIFRKGDTRSRHSAHLKKIRISN